MKAISLWQPWASLWLSPRKVHETRHWPTNNRGWILVHAAQRFEKNFDSHFAAILRAEFGEFWYRDLPRGAIIGAVELLGCSDVEFVYPQACIPEAVANYPDDFFCGNFDQGRFAWQRGSFQVFKQAIPYRGAQGFFNVDETLVPEFRRDAA